MIILCYSGILRSQVISQGYVYGKIETQRTFESYIAPDGSRYSHLFNNGELSFNPDYPVIDSAGFPVTLHGGLHYLIKYDSNGRYQYTLTFYPGQSYSQVSGCFNMCFDAENNAYIFFKVSRFHPIALRHNDGSLFKELSSYVADSTPNAGNYMRSSYSILAKLNSQGRYQWATVMENQSPFTYFSSIIEYIDWNQRIFINANQEVTVQYDNFRPGYTHENDSLLVNSTQGWRQQFPVTTRNVLLRFSANGQLLKAHEPFKTTRSRITPDTFPEHNYRSVCDGVNTYSICRINAYQTDTFWCNTPLRLYPGLNYVLFKSNAQDEIVWAKLIGVDQYTFRSYPFQLDYSPQRRQLALGFAYGPGLFNFVNNQALNRWVFFTDVYVSTYDTSGTLQWENVYGGPANETLESFTYNHKTNQLTLVGTTQSDDLWMGKYLLQANVRDGTSRIYVATVDSNNQVYSAQLVKGPNAQLRPSGLGYPISDHKGRTYISGWFTDSITLACNNTLRATYFISYYDAKTQDGFVLVMNPHVFLDTGVCARMRAPSGRYVWDSTGVYYDTIPDVAGCDSVLVFSLSIWNNKSSIDSTVKVSMRSFSGRFLWDSSGTYYDTIPNMKGCDSVITLRLKVLQTTSRMDTAVCREMRSPSGKYTFKTTGIYRDTLPNASGGDSVMTISVNILQSTSGFDTSSCTAYTGPSGKHTWVVSGIYYDTLVNARGCDSVIRISYSRLAIYTNMVKAVCQSYISPSGKYTYDVSGVYTDTLITTLGCDSIISISLQVIPLMITLSKSNDIYCRFTEAQLQVTGGSSYTWKPVTGLSDATSPQAVARPDTTTLYTVLVNDTLGCSATDSIVVLVTKQAEKKELYNVFTPNGDGLNDCLSLKEIDELDGIHFMIFNRWGTMVFESKNPGGCWNGTDPKGDNLATGVYYFVLKGVNVCGEQMEQHGTITLIR